MKLSGFTFVKNAEKLYIPVKQSILSVLPWVDEFVIALGEGDNDDHTQEIIDSIGSDKIKVIHTKWDIEQYPKNTIYAHETDIAKEACTGDWLVYIQSDEAMHEEDWPKIKSACEKYLDKEEVEGFLFHYKHFWGDYKHYHKSHKWYPKEIRIIRNDSQIHSWRDAQSFRKFEQFDYSYEDYLRKEGSRKLQVIQLNATIFHYGYVRPPKMMSYKSHRARNSFLGKDVDDPNQQLFDYGPLQKLEKFEGTHPKAMHSWMEDFDWGDQLQYQGKIRDDRPLHKHEKFKYRAISWIENNLRGGKHLGGFKNYILLKSKTK